MLKYEVDCMDREEHGVDLRGIRQMEDAKCKYAANLVNLARNSRFAEHCQRVRDLSILQLGQGRDSAAYTN
jgi:hypothetical protein